MPVAHTESKRAVIAAIVGNAAIAVLSQGQLTLNECNVSTRALGAPGLFVSAGGSVFYTGGTISTEGAPRLRGMTQVPRRKESMASFSHAR